MTDTFDQPMSPPLTSPWRPTVPGPLDAIQRAIEKGATPEILKDMMDLQERYEANEARKAFITAFGAARAELKPILKTETAGFNSRRTGDHTEYAFEDLAKIAEYVDPILAKHGLSYWFEPKQDGPLLSITCVLEHIHGHSRRATLTAGHDTSGAKNPIQALGSSATYLERYTLKAVLGLAAGKDDDAQLVGKPPKPTEVLISEAEYQELRKLIVEGNAVEELVCKSYNRTNLDELTRAEFLDAKAKLIRRIKDATHGK